MPTFRSSSSLFTLSWCKSGNMTFQAHNGKYVGAKWVLLLLFHNFSSYYQSFKFFPRRNGHLYATCEAEDDAAQFWFYLINRYTAFPVNKFQCQINFNFPPISAAQSWSSNVSRATWATRLMGPSGWNVTKRAMKPSGSKEGPMGLSILKVFSFFHFSKKLKIENHPTISISISAQNGKYWAVAGDEISVESETPTDFYIELKEPNRICIKNEKGQYLNAEKNGMFKVGETNEPTLWEF